MTRDQALQKIKKCLALAASSNPHEAAAAMRQAQKLMQEHGLDEADVNLADVAEVVMDGRNVPMVRWETGLAKIVADAFGCLTHTGVRLSLNGGATHRRVRAFTFIGVGASAEIAGYAFAVLSRYPASRSRCPRNPGRLPACPNAPIIPMFLYASRIELHARLLLLSLLSIHSSLVNTSPLPFFSW